MRRASKKNRSKKNRSKKRASKKKRSKKKSSKKKRSKKKASKKKRSKKTSSKKKRHVINMSDEIVLKNGTDYFVPFPEPEDVFTGDIKQHSEFFIPLCTLDLKIFNPTWKGICPIVSTVEPDIFGQGFPDFHTYYCRDNWIGYQLSDNKLEYLGDWGVFTKRDNTAYYQSVFEGYDRAKVHFKKYGRLGPYLFRRDYHWKTKDHAVILAIIGGKSVEGNWGTTDFPLQHIEGETLPLTEDGRAFDRLGSIEVGNYIYGDDDAKWAMGCALIAFFDAKEQILLTTFEWT